MLNNSQELVEWAVWAEWEEWEEWVVASILYKLHKKKRTQLKEYSFILE